MKKFTRLAVLALASLLALSACGKKQTAATDRLAQIQQKGELVIASIFLLRSLLASEIDA